MNTRLALLFAAAVASGPTLAADDLAALTKETREGTQPLMAKAVGALKENLNKMSPAGTVDACRETLPGLIKDYREKTGWNIRRVSLKTRNVERSTPDEWEAKMLADFERRAAAGEKRDALEAAEIVSGKDGRVFRYMKALPIQETCLTCHGDAAGFSADLKAKLATHYPADKATGYKVGDIRGALTVKRSLP